MPTASEQVTGGDKGVCAWKGQRADAKSRKECGCKCGCKRLTYERGKKVGVQSRGRSREAAEVVPATW